MYANELFSMETMKQGTDFIIDCPSRFSRLIFDIAIKESADISKNPIRILVSGTDIKPMHDRILEHFEANGGSVEFRKLPRGVFTQNFRISRSENVVSPFPKDTSDLHNVPADYYGKHIYGEEASVLANIFEAVWTGADLVYENLLLPTHEGQDIVRVVSYWDDILASFTANPSRIFQLSPRKFEEMIAELLQREGFDVNVTPPSRDGGRDILAWRETVAGRLLFLVECKRFAPERPVGVSIVRALYGIVEQEKASHGLVVTSSYFTKGAIQFKDKVGYRLGLTDYESLAMWLRSLGNRK